MNGKYLLHAAGDAQFHWDLKSVSTETILSSQLYAGRAGAEKGIASSRENSGELMRYMRLTSKNNEPYFVLNAASGEIIGTSQMYGSAAARDHGITSCMQNGPGAETHDSTRK